MEPNDISGDVNDRSHERNNSPAESKKCSEVSTVLATLSPAGYEARNDRYAHEKHN